MKTVAIQDMNRNRLDQVCMLLIFNMIICIWSVFIHEG
jgi:hypothetical protein